MNSPLPRIVLGIDTSLRSTGIGIIEAQGSRIIPLCHGRIRNPASLSLSQCLVRIHDEITALLEKHTPTEAAVEGIFYGKNPRTMMILCHARGVVIRACAARAIPVFEYEPRTVKQAIAGTGAAEKHQIQMMIGRLLSLREEIPEDAADALAIALTHLHKTTGIRAVAQDPV